MVCPEYHQKRSHKAQDNHLFKRKCKMISDKFIMNEFDPSLHTFSHLLFIDNPFIDAIIDAIQISEHDGEMKIEQRYQKIKTDCKKQSAIINNFKNIFLDSLDQEEGGGGTDKSGEQGKSINQKILEIIKEVEECKDDDGAQDAGFQHFQVPSDSSDQERPLVEKCTRWHSLAYNKKNFKMLLFKLDMFKVKVTQSPQFREILGENEPQFKSLMFKFLKDDYISGNPKLQQSLLDFDYLYSDTGALKESLAASFIDLAMYQRRNLYKALKNVLLVLKVNDVDVLHISPEAKDLPKACNKDSLAAQIKAEQQKFNSGKAFKVGCSEPFSDLSTAKKRFLDMLAACWKHFKDKITDLYHLGVIENVYEQSSTFQGYNDSSLHHLYLHKNKPDKSESTLQSLYYAFTDHPSDPCEPKS